jgi:hypothetical protein
MEWPGPLGPQPSPYGSQLCSPQLKSDLNYQHLSLNKLPVSQFDSQRAPGTLPNSRIRSGKLYLFDRILQTLTRSMNRTDTIGWVSRLVMLCWILALISGASLLGQLSSERQKLSL